MGWSVGTILLSILTVLFLKYLWDRRHILACAWKLPGPSAWLMLRTFSLNCPTDDEYLTRFEKIAQSFKPIFRVWLGTVVLVIISKPEDIEIIINNSLDKEPSYKFSEPFLGRSLVNTSVEQWKKHRKAVALTFNQKILNSFVDTYNKYSNILVEKLEDYCGREHVNIMPILNDCTLDIVCDTMMGVEVHALKDGGKTRGYISWIIRLLRIAINRVSKPWFHIDAIWKLSESFKEMDMLSQKTKNFVRELKAERENLIIEENLHSSSTMIRNQKIFLDYLIELSKKNGSWSEIEVIEETQTMMLAGSETTAYTMSFVLMMLAMHQEVQNKVHEELFTIFGNSNRDVTVEDLPQLKYLDRVIKETLRIFPSGPILARMLREDVTLTSHKLPKGLSVGISVLTLHRDPDIWPEPMKFDPDRFLPEEVAKRHPYAFIPYSAGPRNCIGLKFAEMSMKTILAIVLRHYKITSTDHKAISSIKVKPDLLLKSINGFNVSLQKRDVEM